MPTFKPVVVDGDCLGYFVKNAPSELDIVKKHVDEFFKDSKYKDISYEVTLEKDAGIFEIKIDVPGNPVIKTGCNFSRYIDFSGEKGKVLVHTGLSSAIEYGFEKFNSPASPLQKRIQP